VVPGIQGARARPSHRGGELAGELEHLRRALDLAGVDVGDLVLPAERDVVLRGLRLRYLDWGRAGRPPVLFLHGGALTARTWDLVCLGLRERFHCIALDQRGHGDSDWSPTLDYGLDACVGDLEALVDHLGFERFAIVGQSLGGMAALRYATQHSERLAALVLVDVGPEPSPDGVGRIADFVLEAGESGSLDDFVERARAFNPRRDPTLLRGSLLHNLRPLADGSYTWKYDRRHLSPAYFRTITAELAEVRAHVGGASCPTLVIRGAESDVFTDADAAQFANRLPRGSWLSIDDAGHTVQGDNPRGLVIALRRFLGTHA
jgi:esterase